MQMSILVEPVRGNGFRARAAEPFGLGAEGVTRAEALANLKAEVEARLREGAEVVTLKVGHDSNPWIEFAGMFKDDPLFKEVVKIMAENRRIMDADPDAP
jgi:hypothetical protein